VKKRFRRVETKIDDGLSVYLLIYHDSPVHFVHGAYSTEKKLFGELKRLGKLPEYRLSREQKRHNRNCEKWPLNGRVPFRDPMDNFSIREIGVQ